MRARDGAESRQEKRRREVRRGKELRRDAAECAAEERQRQCSRTKERAQRHALCAAPLDAHALSVYTP